MRSDAVGARSVGGDAAIGALIGATADHLHGNRNSGSMPLTLRHGDRPLPGRFGAPGESACDATDRIVIFVHGSGTTEWSWSSWAADYHGDAAANLGTMLRRDAGYSPVFVRYNGGRHVSDNGLEPALAIESLLDRWTVPLRALVPVGPAWAGRSREARATTAHSRVPLFA